MVLACQHAGDRDEGLVCVIHSGRVFSSKLQLTTGSFPTCGAMWRVKFTKNQASIWPGIFRNDRDKPSDSLVTLGPELHFTRLEPFFSLLAPVKQPTNRHSALLPSTLFNLFYVNPTLYENREAHEDRNRRRTSPSFPGFPCCTCGWCYTCEWHGQVSHVPWPNITHFIS